MKLQKKILLIVAVLFIATPSFAVEQSERADEQAPKVKVTVPGSYWQKKVMLFPLEVPSYALRAATWPLGILFDTLEQKRVILRITDLLSNKEKTLWVYPVIEGGAGTNFGGGPALRYTDLFHDGYNLHAHYKIHINLNQYAGVWMGKSNAAELFGKPLGLFATPVLI